MKTSTSKQRFRVTPDEVAELVMRGHVVEASYGAINPCIYLDLSTPEGKAQGEDLLRIRENPNSGAGQTPSAEETL